ncbi:MAG: hypothetical protein AAB612_01925 [Patescibacteria group bacterium]
MNNFSGEPPIPSLESRTKHRESYKPIMERFLRIGKTYGVRFFDDKSIDDLLYLHRIMMNPSVQQKMTEMEEVIKDWKHRWWKKQKNVYVEEDLREWMKQQGTDCTEVLLAIAEKPHIINSENPPVNTDSPEYKSEVHGYVYIYESAIDKEMLKLFGSLPQDFTGSIMETSSGKYEHAPKGVGIEGRILALAVYRDFYCKKFHTQVPPIFITEVAEDNLGAIKSVVASGYEQIGSYQPPITKTSSPEDLKLSLVFKLNWETHAEALMSLTNR